MKTKNLLWAALSMTAALVMTACSNDDNDMTEAPVAPSTSKTIPYTVTVGGDEATTRATVDGDNRTLRFASGDKLYITGTNIQGVLDLQDGGAGETSNVTFSGDLTYSGEGSPADDLSLTATLVSAQQTDGSEVTINATTGAVTVNYPDNAYCTSINDAVQKYSKLTGTSTYGARAFTLTQQTAFLNFVITFDDGTTTGTELTAVVNNNSSEICSASVTTVTDNGVKAKFVLPVAAGTTLSSAKVTMGDKEAISFGASQELTGKVYNVKKTQGPAGAINGKFSVSSTKQVYFSKGNLQATTTDMGTSWTWAFAANQWDYIGGRHNGGSEPTTGNNFINGNGTVSVNGTVDLFGWSTSATTYGMNNSTSASTYSGAFVDWGSNSELQSALGTGWFTLSSAEWTYLFNTRTVNGGQGSGKSYTLGKYVNGKLGVVIYPDDYTGTVYAGSDWSTFEAAGCVFLPAAGDRSGYWVNNAGSQGYYWSSSLVNDYSAYIVYFSSSNLNPAYTWSRYYGCSVRLVRDVE